jgi:hypothetical protein
MQLTKYFLIIFLCHFFCSLNSQSYSTDLLLFEKQIVYKNLGHEFFIKGDLGSVNQAYEYYKMAQSIEYDSSKVVNSNYYSLKDSYGNIGLLIQMQKIDIQYRISLIEAGMDFYGNMFNSNFEKPIIHFKAFKDHFEQLKNFKIEIDDLKINSQSGQIEEIKIKNESTIKQFAQQITKVDEKINELTNNFQSNNIINLETSISNNNQMIAGINQECLNILNNVDRLEKELLKDATNAVISISGANDLISAGNSNPKFGGLDLISGFQDKGIIKSLMQNSTSTYEFLNTMNEASNLYQKVKTSYDTYNNIKQKIDNNNFKIDDLVDLGITIGNDFSTYPNSNKLGHDIIEKSNWLRQANHLITSVNKNGDVMSCLKSNTTTSKVECVRNKLNAIQGSAKKVDRKLFDWIVDEENIPKDLEIIKHIEDLELSEYSNLFNKYKDIIDPNNLKVIEPLLSDFDNIDVKKSIDIFLVLGDSVFNRILPEDKKMEWNDFIKKAKSLQLLVTFLEQQNKDDLLKDLYIEILVTIENNDITNILYGEIIAQISDYKKSRSDSFNSNIEKFILQNFLEEFNKVIETKGVFKGNGIKLKDLKKLLTENRIAINDSKLFAPSSMQGQEIIEYALKEPFPNFVKRCLVQKINKQILAEFLKQNKDELKLNLNIVNNIVQKYVEPESIIKLYEIYLSKIDQNEVMTYNGFATKYFIGKYTYLQENFQKEISEEDFKNIFNQLPYEKSVTSSSANTNAMINKAIIVGLDYLMPGLGSSVSAVNKYFNINSQMKEYEKKYNLLREKEKENIRLLSEKQNFEFQRNINQLELQKLKLQDQLIRSQSAALSNIQAIYSDQNEAIRARLSQILPIFYYLAELLRKDYYLLNASLKHWKGDSFQEIIVNDLNNMRLALDPAIKLFNWFRLDNSGKRTMPIVIYNEFENLNTLIDQKFMLFDADKKFEVSTVKKVINMINVQNRYEVSFTQSDFKLDKSDNSNYSNNIILQCLVIPLNNQGNELITPLTGATIQPNKISKYKQKSGLKSLLNIEYQVSDLLNFQVTRNNLISMIDRAKLYKILDTEKTVNDNKYLGIGAESSFIIEFQSPIENLSKLEFYLVYSYRNTQIKESSRIFKINSRDNGLAKHSKFSMYLPESLFDFIGNTKNNILNNKTYVQEATEPVIHLPK